MAPVPSAKKKKNVEPQADHQVAKPKAAKSKKAAAEPVPAKEPTKRKNTEAASPSDTKGKKPKKASAIDDIFATTKEVKKATAAEEKAKKKEEEDIAKLVSEHPPEFEKLGTSGRKTTGDSDNLFVYSDKELKVGLGKNTKDCPFDCWCCY
uniref:DUF1764 domain-containing protein n=1 Tax=Pyramimonas obovata TaxID=1411642 RepID=A0A7S0N9W5_9CHLO|mmetsp:Transcript_2356/g.4786  ORF Transcript_2356/g.4786 Transcript_2356/m.4786 type:complete len:151 (+) Transcript_2356:86-538(+)